jgi:hypothetical protein
MSGQNNFYFLVLESAPGISSRGVLLNGGQMCELGVNKKAVHEGTNYVNG